MRLINDSLNIQKCSIFSLNSHSLCVSISRNLSNPFDKLLNRLTKAKHQSKGIRLYVGPPSLMLFCASS